MSFSFNYYIWKYLYNKELRTAEEVELAYQKGILTQAERDDILGTA